MVCPKVTILSKMGHFGQKSAGFIRVWRCVILSDIDSSGSTNFRLDFSDFGPSGESIKRLMRGYTIVKS